MKRDDLGHEERIQRTVRQLRACRSDYGLIHVELDRRRQAWWEANREALRLEGPLPRRAYTMFLLQHLGLGRLEHLRQIYAAEGTDEAFTEWLDRWCRQAAIQFILRILFLRVLEDRELLGATRLRTTY